MKHQNPVVILLMMTDIQTYWNINPQKVYPLMNLLGSVFLKMVLPPVPRVSFPITFLYQWGIKTEGNLWRASYSTTSLLKIYRWTVRHEFTGLTIQCCFRSLFHFILPVGDYVNHTKIFIWLNTVALYTFSIFVVVSVTNVFNIRRILAYRKRLFVSDTKLADFPEWGTARHSSWFHCGKKGLWSF